MAANSGNLAAAVPSAGDDVDFYTAPAERKAVGTMTFNNRARATSTIAMAVTAGGLPRAEDWLFEEMVMTALPVTVTGVVVGAGQKIFVRTSGLVGVNYNGATSTDI
jgi:hypothetical protein